MRKTLIGVCVSTALIALAAPTKATASPILQDYLFNVNGTAFCPDSLCGSATPGSGLDASAFDFASGLGTLVFTLDATTTSTYFIDAFFDHTLHAPFYDEFGSANGSAVPGLSWQIDEPGFGDGNRLGTIFDLARANSLDNANHVPGGLSNFLNDCGGNSGGVPSPSCNNDVAMALGFNFALNAGDHAMVTIVASNVAPASGFYLRQHDPDSTSGNDVFLSGRADVHAVPEPAILLQMGAGCLTCLAGIRVRRWRARREAA